MFQALCVLMIYCVLNNNTFKLYKSSDLDCGWGDPGSNPGKGWRTKYTPYCLCIFSLVSQFQNSFVEKEVEVVITNRFTT